ncbi:BREX-1 system phosphatase PglZ type B [Pseudoalteromonas fenneropenaei]|uniref:BREX-1 system phosphatase PglZ type B n=1 Tax=Pseudoalteromonas fenneropenaei TaxID=1737459 RepID=A0ABV7CPZ3_9GAMM
MLVVSQLIQQLRQCATFNPASQVAPAVVLWTDKDGQWKKAMPYIKEQLPELIELVEPDGFYQPDKRIGPAIWVKCIVAGTLEENLIPEGKTPILYMPGVERKDLRAIESCPERLQPLAELQYRGCWWVYNTAGRDWSVSAFLTNPAVGIEFDIAKDKRTQEAIVQILPELLETPIDKLQGRKLQADDFYALVMDDLPRDILSWLNNPHEKQELWQGSKWDVFSTSCFNQYGFKADSSDIESALHLLCQAEHAWQPVWARFADTAINLPNLLEQLKRIAFDGLSAVNPENYLSENIRDDQDIEATFKRVSTQDRQAIKAALEQIWHTQAARQSWLWTRLGYSPWLEILREVMTVLTHTERVYSGSTPESMAQHYQEQFWQVDAAVLKAMAKAKDIHQQETLAQVLSVIYTPWLEQTTLNFQQLVETQYYPGHNQVNEPSGNYRTASHVLFFVDGLRFDTAKWLEQKLVDVGLSSHLSTRWAALPSLTATAKAAVTPVVDLLKGQLDNAYFKPVVADTDAEFSSHQLKKLLAENGWQYLDGLETGDPQGLAWVQTGDLDNLGHAQQRKLPLFIEGVLNDVVSRIRALVDAGWGKVTIVTDHGWLWVPDGLPSADLHKSLGKNRQRRCAILKDNVQHDGLVMPWFWNPDVSIAMAPGISAFVAGDHYNHGGLSLQECLTPTLVVTINNA